MPQVQCPICFAPVHLPDGFTSGDAFCPSCENRFNVEAAEPSQSDRITASVIIIAKWFFIALGATGLFLLAYCIWEWPPLLWLSALPIAVFHVCTVIFGLAYLRAIAFK